MSISAVTVIHAYEESLAALRRWEKQGPTDDEKIQFLQAAVSSYQDPAQVAQFSTDIKQVAIAALKAHEAFEGANQYLKNYISQHGQTFPGLSPYQQRWGRFKARWAILLWISRVFALQTSASYKEYDEILLQMVDTVKTKEDMEKAAAALERFSAEKPTDIPSDFSQQFLELRRDINPFLVEFSKYLDELGAIIPMDLIMMSFLVTSLRSEVDSYTQQINALLAFFGVPSWTQLSPGTVPYVIIMPLVTYRASLQQTLDKYEAGLNGIIQRQEGLVRIKAQFTALSLDIFDSLHVISTTWAEFHSEALQFAEILRKLPSVEFPMEFRLRVELARKTAGPLQAGLQDYANEIGRIV